MRRYALAALLFVSGDALAQGQGRTPLSRALADALYCKVAGTCTLENLTVTGTCTGCGGGGVGDVVGPASATDGALPLFDGTTGKLLKDSVLITANTAGTLLPARVHLGGTLTTANISLLNGGANILRLNRTTKTWDLDITAVSGSVAVTVPNASGEMTLLGNAVTGTGSVVRATSPTVSDLTVTGSCTGCGGFTAAGSGSEIQARSTGTTVQAVTGSSTADGGIALVNQSAAAVPLSVQAAASQSGNILEVKNSGGTAISYFTSAGYLRLATTSSAAATNALQLGAAGNGLFMDGNYGPAMSVNGVEAFAINDSVGMWINSSWALGWTAPSGVSTTRDTNLSRKAAGVIAFGTGTTGETDGFFRYGGTCIVATDQTNATTTPQTAACYETTSGTVAINLAAGRTYTGKCSLFLNDSVATDGAAIDFDGGTATATTFRAQVTAFDTALNLSTQVTALATDASTSTFTGNGAFEVHFGIKVNAAGTFQPRFFQAVHTTGTLTLAALSHCTLVDATP